MQSSYTLSEQEVINAMMVHGRGTNKTLILLAICGLVLAVFIGIGRNAVVGLGSFLGGVGGYFGVLYLLIPSRARKQYKQLRALRSEIAMSASDAGICFTSEAGESRLQWQDIHKWKYRNGVFLLYITSDMFHMVPARVLESDLTFIELLESNIGPRQA